MDGAMFFATILIAPMIVEQQAHQIVGKDVN
jgi:hypothetical protein